MKVWFPKLLLSLPIISACLAHADAPLPADYLRRAPNGPVAAPLPGARPSDEAIRAAVREILAEVPARSLYGSDTAPAGGTALSGGAYREFARQFSLAGKPHCLGPDPLRHQPHGFVAKTVLGDYVIGASGIFVLPFWGAAIVRGKCSWTR